MEGFPVLFLKLKQRFPPDVLQRLSKLSWEQLSRWEQRSQMRSQFFPSRPIQKKRKLVNTFVFGCFVGIRTDVGFWAQVKEPRAFGIQTKKDENLMTLVDWERCKHFGVASKKTLGKQGLLTDLHHNCALSGQQQSYVQF